MKRLKKFVFRWAFLIFMTVVRSEEVGNLKDGEPFAIPQAPKPPNCGTSFPGSPQWNRCWEHFRMDMAWFQQNMQDYGARMSKLIDKNTSKNKSDFSKQGGTSNVMTGGYTIQTKGIPISTITQDGKFQIKLGIPGMEEIKSKLSGNELELQIGGNENGRWAIIRFPDSVKYADLKIQRTDEALLINAPVKNNGNSITQQSSSYNNFMSPLFQQPVSSGGGFMGPSRAGQPPQMWYF